MTDPSSPWYLFTSTKFVSKKSSIITRITQTPSESAELRYIYLLASIPALLLTVLLFMDQQITSVIVNRKEHKLKVGFRRSYTHSAAISWEGGKRPLRLAKKQAMLSPKAGV